MKNRVKNRNLVSTAQASVEPEASDLVAGEPGPSH